MNLHTNKNLTIKTAQTLAFFILARSRFWCSVSHIGEVQNFSGFPHSRE